MKIELPLDALPAPRPRFFNGRAYDPPASRKFKADFAQLILPQVRNHEKFTGALRVELKICRNKKSAIAKNYGDADNLAKPILDAITMTGAVWQDDCQVTDLRVIKETAPEPHIEITIEEC